MQLREFVWTRARIYALGYKTCLTISFLKTQQINVKFDIELNPTSAYTPFYFMQTLPLKRFIEEIRGGVSVHT